MKPIIRKYLPLGYLKKVNKQLAVPVSYSTISKTLANPELNEEVREAIGWVGIEYTLNKLFHADNI